MQIFILLIYILVAAIFGWLCADTVFELEKANHKKSWLGWVIMAVGLLFVFVSGWQTKYAWKHRIYEADKYEIQYNTEYFGTNQIDSTVTFKIVEKNEE